MILFSVIMAMTINPKMAMIFLCILPILAAVLFGIAMHVHPIFKRIFKKYDALNNSVQENVAGIRVVKSFVREAYETEKFDKAAEEVRKDFTFVEKILAFNNPTMMFCMYLSMFLVYYLGARIIVNTGATELTTGQLSSLITYGVQILISVMMLSMVFIMTTMASECAERIAEVLTHESSLKMVRSRWQTEAWISTMFPLNIPRRARSSRWLTLTCIFRPVLPWASSAEPVLPRPP